MRFVPKDGRAQAMRRRQLGQDLPIVVFSWGPVPLPQSRASTETHDTPGDEIDSKPVLMCALPRSNFRGAFGEQVCLPVGTAETLERFYEGLRLVGLVGKGQVLRQSAKDPAHFRVQVGNRKLLASDIHEHSSLFTRSIGAVEKPGDRSNTLGRRSRGFSSKLVSSLESDESRNLVHDRRPKGGRKAPT